MRRVSSLLVPVLLGLLCGPLPADQVVLKDGRTLETKKPPVVKGRQAVLTLADGKLVSIPAAEIDAEKTAAAAKKAAEAKAAPQPTPTPPRAPTLVDAAQAGRNAKKATVVLTDQDVAGGLVEVSSGSPAKGEGEVTIGPVTTKKDAAGWTIEGSVMNSGKAPVVGVSVTIEAVGAEGKRLATTFGQLAKDTLDPGETASFRATVAGAEKVERFAYVPRWKIVAPARKVGEADSDAAGPGDSGGGEAPPAEESPEGRRRATPTPEPAHEPPPPQYPPDVAPPTANAPVGAPAQPGGAYLPPPSANQPKPPGGSL